MTFTEYFEDAPQMTSGEKKKLSAITIKLSTRFTSKNNSSLDVHVTPQWKCISRRNLPEHKLI